MADADGATTFSELEKLEDSMHLGYDVVVGSRNQDNDSATVKVII